MGALNSLKSRGYVKEQFAWRHYYWYLTNEGISYLRSYLHLPPEIVPSTLKRQVRPVPELDQVLVDQVVVVLVTNLQMIVLLTEEHLVPMVTKLELPDQEAHLWNSEEDLDVAKQNKHP